VFFEEEGFLFQAMIFIEPDRFCIAWHDCQRYLGTILLAKPGKQFSHQCAAHALPAHAFLNDKFFDQARICGMIQVGAKRVSEQADHTFLRFGQEDLSRGCGKVFHHVGFCHRTMVATCCGQSLDQLDNRSRIRRLRFSYKGTYFSIQLKYSKAFVL
jgi:hypothetical protein